MLTEEFYFLNPKLPLRFPFSSSLGYTLTVRPAFVLFISAWRERVPVRRSD